MSSFNNSASELLETLFPIWPLFEKSSWLKFNISANNSIGLANRIELNDYLDELFLKKKSVIVEKVLFISIKDYSTKIYFGPVYGREKSLQINSKSLL